MPRHYVLIHFVTNLLGLEAQLPHNKEHMVEKL